jgi:cytochrome c oxidase subunit 2
MINSNIKWILIPIGAVLLVGCSVLTRRSFFGSGSGQDLEGPPNANNGERIYFTGESARGTRIDYVGGPNFGGMMMGTFLTCASCHGPEARGGTHMMHMQVMDAPDITYSSLSGEDDEHGDEDHGDEGQGYNLETFRKAVINGKHPDGESLSREMPRWQMSDEDLSDMLEFLKELSN